MVWKPGQTGNPQGRPRKYQSTEEMSDRVIYHSLKIAAIRDEYRAIAEAQDLEDPILFQHRLLSDESIPIVARAMIANQIGRYYRPLLGTMEPARYVQQPIDVPSFTTIEEAEAFLLTLAQRTASQELDLASVEAVSARVRDWINSKRAGQELEIKRLNASQDTGDQTIHITGGLPELPGCNISMPQLNGHASDGLLPKQPVIVDHDPNPQTPAEPKSK
jgi:hypothetical protein